VSITNPTLQHSFKLSFNMKINILLICFVFFLANHNLLSQVGIGTISPDSSAVLDLTSVEKGLLIPRLTTVQRDQILLPAKGLMIYNLITNEIQVNSGTPNLPAWNGSVGSPDTTIFSITSSGDISTFSTIDVPIPGMSLTPASGTYLVLFNAQYGLTASEPVNTTQGVADLQDIYNSLMALSVTNPTHDAVFGNGETLMPGVYSVAGAISTAGILTLDGGNDTNSIFVIRTGGAFAAGAATTIVLVNGARSENIFWVSEGALSIAANSIMKGSFIAHAGAVSAAAGTDLQGRLFSLAGAISFGPGTATIPVAPSFIDLGVLASFVMFTATGAVSNTEPSMITGDVGTNSGAISGFENLDGNVYGPGMAPNPTNNTLLSLSLFQNGILIPYSTRTSDINTSTLSLQAVSTVLGGQAIEAYWSVDTGGVVVGNRILSLIRID